MLCENAYYPNGDETLKPNCKCDRADEDVAVFGNVCPLIYYCRVNERYENTDDMLHCKYRGRT